jgi:hypothetical protein
MMEVTRCNGKERTMQRLPKLSFEVAAAVQPFILHRQFLIQGHQQ